MHQDYKLKIEFENCSYDSPYLVEGCANSCIKLQEERLVWLGNEQAIMSPEWSIHAVAGTSNYMFIWGMAGENLDHNDMDKIPYTEMK